MKMFAPWALLAAMLLPGAAGASDFGLDAHAGTLGFGAEVNYTISPYFTTRLDFNRYNYSFNGTKQQIDYNFDLHLKSYALLLDAHPFQGAFRVTAGLFSNKNDIAAVAVPQGSYTINGHTYTAAQVVTLYGNIGFNATAPYLGFGWSTLGTDSTGLGFEFDIGVLFQGSPKVSLAATGPVSKNAQFQSDLAAEQAKVEDDMSSYKTYPVVGLGITYRF